MPGTITQKVNDMYQLGMDSVRLNAEKAEPLQADLQHIATAKRADFIDIITWLHKGIGAPFFDTGVMSDLMDSNINIMYVSLAGLGLGDRDYYLDTDENSVRIRNAYAGYIETVFTLAGYKKKDAKAAARNVMKIETAIAKVTFTREESRDIAKQYNIRTMDQLKTDYANIDWAAYFAGLGLPGVDKVCVDNLKGLAEVNNMIKTLTDKEIKDYFAFEYISSASSFLSDDFNEANFEMFSKTLSGKKEMQPRWKRAIATPNGLLGEAVGKLYVEKYFPGKGEEYAAKLRDCTIALYKKCADYALTRGIIIADTKFEFGLDENGNIVLGDEMLTPDSSRFWPADVYEPGHGQPSFDKQFARDWLKANPGNDWTLPEEIVDKTIGKYLQGYEMLTGKKL